MNKDTKTEILIEEEKKADISDVTATAASDGTAVNGAVEEASGETVFKTLNEEVEEASNNTVYAAVEASEKSTEEKPAAQVVFEAAVASAETITAAPLAQKEQTSEQIEYKKRRGFKYGCYLFVKRTFDIVASGLFLIVFSWLYLILAIVVKCSDGGKVFYRHRRVGKNGKDIYIPKFRSMKKNADDLAHMLTPEQLEQYKREYKIDNDPRITKVGSFLRKTSLDELPNIWAIFIGDISVIGPRPLMREEAEEKYGEDVKKLLSVRPGMIGWWAANGRSNTTYESGKRQKLELYYVDHCSVWLDIKIIFKTIVGVFKREGAK